MSDAPSPPSGGSKRIYYMVEAMWAVAWYRCHVPGSALKRRGHDVILLDRLDRDVLMQCDIAVFERPSVASTVEAIKWARVAGKRTVVDVDDDYWNLHPSNPSYSIWKTPSRTAALNDAIRSADCVTVSTEQLVPLVRPLNPRVFVLPNMLPPENWPAAPPVREAGDRLTIGWAGSPSHTVDLEILAGTVETLLDTYPHTEFLCAGMTNGPFRWHERIRFKEPVKIEEYPSVLEEIDIGLIPLVDGRFNRCKSDLKFLEYSMMGIPTVASKVAPYEGSVVHGENGFLARNPKDWLKYTSRLIEDAGLRAELGARARGFAETRMIDPNIGKWERAYGF